MGKASELRAAWQLSFFLQAIFILIIFALPLNMKAHGGEWKLLLLSLGFIAVFIKSAIDKRRYPSLTSFFLHVQTIMLSIACMLVITGLSFWFDQLFIEWLGRNNNYASLVFGLLSAIACFLLIWRNPDSVRYVPYIINLILLLSFLFEHFDPLVLPGLILTAITSFLGYYLGKKKARLSHGR